MIYHHLPTKTSVLLPPTHGRLRNKVTSHSTYPSNVTHYSPNSSRDWITPLSAPHHLWTPLYHLQEGITRNSSNDHLRTSNWPNNSNKLCSNCLNNVKPPTVVVSVPRLTREMSYLGCNRNSSTVNSPLKWLGWSITSLQWLNSRVVKDCYRLWRRGKSSTTAHFPRLKQTADLLWYHLKTIPNSWHN